MPIGSAGLETVSNICRQSCADCQLRVAKNRQHIAWQNMGAGLNSIHDPSLQNN
ncbi:hypothetical protein [Blastomonas aquatica]|uniref:hypothetical protein n=1 Tax=Blastomonas aquatica TaxID=1510276 RepID=UPI00166AF05A